MTLAIAWRPSDEGGKRLDVGAPHTFVDIMEAAGFRFPCTLTTEDRPVLHGMAIVFGRNGDDNTPNPFKQLVNLLDEYESIDLNTVV